MDSSEVLYESTMIFQYYHLGILCANGAGAYMAVPEEFSQVFDGLRHSPTVIRQKLRELLSLPPRNSGVAW